MNEQDKYRFETASKWFIILVILLAVVKWLFKV